MSYTELESGYQEARAEKPEFFVGEVCILDEIKFFAKFFSFCIYRSTYID